MTVYRKPPSQTSAIQIRDEVRDKANTAQRVGADLLTLTNASMFGIDITSYTVDPSYTGAVNDVGIAAAIADAVANNAFIWWPFGTYQSAASRANFHSVQHRGPGAIQRGSDVFYVDPTRTQTNTIYVSASGSSGNDGLSSSQPTTLTSIPTVLGNYGYLDGTWIVQLAAGTYSPGAQTTIDGYKSRNPIQFKGPSVGGSPNVPTAIVDGTGTVNGTCGIYIRNGVRALVQDVKVQNFSSTDGCGIIADRHCELQCTNVHTTGNDLAGIDAECATRLYVSGGIHAGNNFYNIRAYAQCCVSLGYGGSHASNRMTVGAVVNGGGAGILVRDNSSGHIDYTDINGVAGSSGGINVVNQSRVHLVDCTFGGTSANYYNLRLDDQSTFIDSGSTFNAATAKSIVEFGFSLDNAGNQLAYYDNATGFFKWGRTDDLTPKALFNIKDTATAAWGGTYNGAVFLGIDSTASATYIGLGAPNNAECGIMFADVAGNRQGQIGYLHTSDRFLVRVNAIDAFSLFADGAAGGYLRSEVTGANAAALGDATHGWRALFVGTGTPAKVSSGTGSPAGVVTGSVGDIWLRTDGGAGTTLYVKESGTATTAGWVGK